MRRRVVITGTGAVTPFGTGVRALFAGLVGARTATGPITRFDARSFPNRVAAEVPGYDPRAHDPGADWWFKTGLNTWFAVTAAREAVGEAGLDLKRTDPGRVGVYLGCGEGDQHFDAVMSSVAGSYRPDSAALDGRAFAAATLSAYDPVLMHEQDLHVPAARLAQVFGLEGPNYSCLTACAAGTQAIGEAAELIRDGAADVMLTGGSHSIIHPLALTGFARLSALSARNDDPATASRPFDLTRDGFVPGEGAAVVVLESLEHARRRGTRVLAELTGYGATADAYRVTDPHPEGRGAIRCMTDALADAGLDAADIGYVNAHGTGTPANDRVETRALKAVFGARAYRLPVSSSKSMIGHLIAAAGAVETLACVLALTRDVLPPTLNLNTPDPECDLDYVPHAPRPARVSHALNNSFGFGGANASLIISRFVG
jgi:3-oxoacyl-[acyl-carrier-protein] synthase II